MLAWILVPKLETHPHKFDLVGVFLSAVGLFLIVFGLQEGETYDWGPIWGPITVWHLIIAGVLIFVGKRLIRKIGPPERAIQTSKETAAYLKGDRPADATTVAP